ncbi:M16 family metallopeptidase [Coralliovum pocilloporae]|uniref:M16 family metallopeptidase n=1 Tax=Coralliovum pocilloporae TaxID=3066369 RepID=UPI003306A239
MTVRVTQLETGLTVATETMPHLQSAALGIWVAAGARVETAAQQGISHLLEHMAFKGTKTRNALEIAEEIEAVGGELNASTGVETTAFYARVLKEDTPLALDILSDILTHSVFDDQELRREQHVILQELGAALDTPDDRVFDIFQETAFPDQPLGRNILGTRETITRIGSADLRSFMKTHYRGSSMVLVAAGGVDHDEIVALAREKLADVSTGTTPDMEEGNYVGGDRREVRDLMEAQLTLGFKGRTYRCDDFYTAQLLAAVMGGGMSSQLFQEVREKRGLCYSVYAFHWGFSDTGLFGVHAATGEEDIEELMPVIINELGKAKDRIEDDDVARAKAQMKAGLLMGLESPASRAGQIARQIIVFGKPMMLDEIVARIDNVSTQAIRDLSVEIFSQSMPTLAAVGPVSRIPAASDIASALAA